MYKRLLASTALVAAGMVATSTHGGTRESINPVAFMDSGDGGGGENGSSGSGSETEGGFITNGGGGGAKHTKHMPGTDFFPMNVVEASKRGPTLIPVPTVH